MLLQKTECTHFLICSLADRSARHSAKLELSYLALFDFLIWTFLDDRFFGPVGQRVWSRGVLKMVRGVLKMVPIDRSRRERSIGTRIFPWNVIFQQFLDLLPEPARAPIRVFRVSNKKAVPADRVYSLSYLALFERSEIALDTRILTLTFLK